MQDRPRNPPVNAAQHSGSGLRRDLDDDELQTESTEEALPSDAEARKDPEVALGKTKSAASIAETLPLYREVLFVAVICCGQLFTREWPLHYSL